MKIDHQRVVAYRVHKGVGFALYEDGTLFRRQASKAWEHIKANMSMWPTPERPLS